MRGWGEVILMLPSGNSHSITDKSILSGSRGATNYRHSCFHEAPCIRAGANYEILTRLIGKVERMPLGSKSIIEERPVKKAPVNCLSKGMVLMQKLVSLTLGV